MCVCLLIYIEHYHRLTQSKIPIAFYVALSKVLTCEIAPTEGDIQVFGHSIKSNPSAIRRLVGVCKQDDYLWPNLSAKEHLDIFAGLRGVPLDEHEAIVQKWLESVDLDTAQHQRSSQYSGGMKRRLSLAMSTIGSQSLIVLDEPTTGTRTFFPDKTNVFCEYTTFLITINYVCIFSIPRRDGPGESTICLEAH
jgi:ABC-type Na+ transport system ATPase subunit NatA